MGRNHNIKLKEAKKEKEELFRSGIEVGHKINCDGTKSQRFWRRDLLLLRYYCIDCNDSFQTGEAKESHMKDTHNRQVVCSQCDQVVPSNDAAHVLTVPEGFKDHASIAGTSGGGTDE